MTAERHERVQGPFGFEAKLAARIAAQPLQEA
jgi:hypothetical protein